MALPLRARLALAGPAEEVLGHPREVGPHRLDRGVGVPRPERGHDLTVILLVGGPALAGGAAPLEIPQTWPCLANSITRYNSDSSGLCAAAMMAWCRARSQDSNSS